MNCAAMHEVVTVVDGEWRGGGGEWKGVHPATLFFFLTKKLCFCCKQFFLGVQVCQNEYNY